MLLRIYNNFWKMYTTNKVQKLVLSIAEYPFSQTLPMLVPSISVKIASAFCPSLAIANIGLPP